MQIMFFPPFFEAPGYNFRVFRRGFQLSELVLLNFIVSLWFTGVM